MNEAQIKAALLPLYHRAGGRQEAGIDEMLHRIADDSSCLLRMQVFPPAFEAAALGATLTYACEDERSAFREGVSAKASAVLVIHGMGQQVPYETLDATYRSHTRISPPPSQRSRSGFRS